MDRPVRAVEMLSSAMLRQTSLFFVLWRLMSVYIVQTFHVPDEYWQSLEVAHHLAFGYGHLTWEWKARIRSYIYPFIISVLYRILAYLRLDYTILLINAPRIFQAILVSYADYEFYLWTRSKWARFSLCINFFWYYCASRTLANSFETALTTIALTRFPWPNDRPHGSAFLWIVAFLVAVRPTAAILWIPLCIYHAWNLDSISEILKTYGKIGLVTLFYSTLIDYVCYGAFVVTPWEFFKVNVLNGVASYYGTHAFFWYILVGLPILLGPQVLVFPVAAVGALKSFKTHRQQILMLVTIVWTILVYSLLDHKEFRFILPLLPLLVHVCTSSSNFPTRIRMTGIRQQILLFLFTISNVLPALYLSLIHQRGSLDAMPLLKQELINANGTFNSVMFLTPCHATPMYSYLHIDAPIKFLTCEPNLQNLPDYRDEADQFFADPQNWLNANMKGNDSFVPDLLVLFDHLPTKISLYLRPYRLVAKIFHAHFPQPNYGEYIMIYRRK